jgi:hypothetical protein
VPLQGLADAPEHRVAGGVAQGVVDALEVVQVEEEEGMFRNFWKS